MGTVTRSLDLADPATRGFPGHRLWVALEAVSPGTVVCRVTQARRARHAIASFEAGDVPWHALPDGTVELDRTHVLGPADAAVVGGYLASLAPEGREGSTAAPRHMAREVS